MIKERLIKFFFSRMFLLNLIVIVVGGILVYRIFDLQIVNGEDYLNNFQLKIKKERTIMSTRGKIYDRSGNILAYNELAYAVTIEDVFESGNNKNRLLNDTIYKTIKMIEQNGDSVIHDFAIELNENNEYVFNVTENTLLRFLADIYGYTYISDLKYSEKTSTADDIINYMSSQKYYAIGNYEDPETKTGFVPGLGYTKDEVLKMITIRYAMSANNYQKYIATTIATDVSEETVAVIMENSSQLDGVNISEETARRYVDGVYFSAILGYTGKVSSDELELLKESNEDYTSSDMVGKTGIEQSMELELQGKKGSETVYVDNLGRVIESSEYTEPIAGNDVYLTIDKDLQIATYKILEQKIAGILVSKIDNIKEYIPAEGASQKKIRIAIYDVYNALFENNVIKLKLLQSEDACDTSITVYNAFVDRREEIISLLNDELMEKETIYSKLSKELQVYESYIVSLLSSEQVNILDKSLIDTNDETYVKWKSEESISLKEYLFYAISMGWIHVDKLDLTNQYSDTEEIYTRLVEVILDKLLHDSDFSKKIIKYMIKDSKITGKQVCIILCDEGIVSVEDEEYEKLLSGKESPYDFMIARISNLDITPAQLALDPCSGSIVITDVNTGDVLALVTYPSYDNNKMANSIDAEYYNDILHDASRPLWNYATQQTSAPGSIFKMVTASAVLEEGIINTSTKVTCKGTFDALYPTVYKCWIYPSAHGSINVTTAIAKSCNSFFYEMGYRLSTVNTAYNSELGLALLKKYADQYGLSDVSGIEIPEATPSVSDAYSVMSAIGQGTNDFTTVGLARYVTTIANSGICYNLTLVDKVTDSEGILAYDNKAEVKNIADFSTTTWNVLHEGMRQVVEGKTYFSDFPIKVAGKTGTAQESTLRPTHALFVCYAPYDEPEIAIATRIAFGYGSDYAAETAKSVLSYYFKVDTNVIDGQASELESSGTSND